MTKYDFAFSFAGEDRPFVERIAKELKNKSLSVFYDLFYTSELWGKDLSIELPLRYSNSNYAVLFISDNYYNKMWPFLERQFILENYYKKKGEEYILLVYLDGCTRKLPGLSGLVGYISINSQTDISLLSNLLFEKHYSSKRQP